MQPAGRQWDHFHEITLRWLGTIVILGMIVALGAAYLIMGRLRISKGRSGRKVPRFNGFERFSHWLTAVSFVILGLTGLNITFGKIVLLPMIGPEAFSSLSQAAKYVHNYVSASFVDRPRTYCRAMDKGQHPAKSRRRLGQARWRLHQIKACALLVVSMLARSWCFGLPSVLEWQ